MNGQKGTLDELRIDRTSGPQSKPNRQWLAGLAVLAVVSAGAIWWFTRAQPVEVKTLLVPSATSNGSGSSRTVLNASGYVTPRREGTISSKVTGKVVEVLVEEGLRVQAGQVLARLDDTNLRAALRLAEAQFVSSKTLLEETSVRLQQSERDLKRASDLAGNGIATQADLELARSEAQAQAARLRRLEAEVAVAERQVAVMQQQLDDTVIRAPFGGIVTSKNAQPGEMISPMSAGGFTRTGICTIVDMDSLEVEVDVNEGYINRVEPNQPVEAKLDAYPDWIIPCHVIAIIPTADRQKATVKVRVRFDKLDPRILPQMAVKVAFRGTETAGSAPISKTVSVPRTVVQSIDGRDGVFVISNGRAERRAVTLGVSTGDEVLIVSGLAGGEKVVSDPPKGLADGAAIREAKP